MLKTEPVALYTGIAVVAVSAAAAFGVGLDTSVVETFIADGALIVTGFLARRKVSPVG